MTYLSTSSLDFATELRKDKLNDNVAHALLAVEAQGHDDGWDHPANQPNLLSINAHPQTSRVRIGWGQALTVAWRRMMQAFPPHQTGAALVEVARHAHGEITSGRSKLDEPVWPLHGYGVRTEIYTAVNKERVNPAEAIRDGTFFEDPDTKEARTITFVDVNGIAWWVVRLRDEQPEIGAGACTDEGAYTFTHGLDGLIAAVLGRPFPER